MAPQDNDPNVLPDSIPVADPNTSAADTSTQAPENTEKPEQGGEAPEEVVKAEEREIVYSPNPTVNARLKAAAAAPEPRTAAMYDEIKGHLDTILMLLPSVIKAVVPGSTLGGQISTVLEYIGKYMKFGDVAFSSLEDLTKGFRDIHNEVAEMVQAGKSVPLEAWDGRHADLQDALDRIGKAMI